MRFRNDDPPSGKHHSDDPFAEFPVEPGTGADSDKDHDWLAEFPDEKATSAAVRSKTWRRLSESLKDDNG